MNDETVILNSADQSLENVAEDNESGESETVTEVEVSEKTLKFKISTECTVTPGRKSYPGSRKGSRERVQNLNSSDIARMMQKGKLKAGALSFDQQCLSSHKSKLSFDSPEFFDEYAITHKRFHDYSVGDAGADDVQASECVLSKETLNLNKRNSEHSVKVPSSVDEKRSILKNATDKSSPVKIVDDDNEVKCEENGKPANHEQSKKNFLIKTFVRQTTIGKTSDVNSIAVEKGDVNSDVLSDSENANKNNRSLLQRFKNFADKFSMSVEKDPKTKKFISLKNNNRMTLPSRGRKKMESPCCKSMENVDDRKASTLPKIKKSGLKKGWKFLLLSKETKNSESLEGWASDADVKASSNPESDNHSLPSTSKSQSNCTLNASPKSGMGEYKNATPFDESDEICKKPLSLESEKILETSFATEEQKLIIATENSANII